MKIAICVATFHRPVGLRRLLTAMAALEIRELDLTVRVVIVDNDPDSSAGQVVEDFRSCAPWSIEYLVEPNQGIPHARNMAVSHAWDSDLIGFIDDDESPQPDWLYVLVRAMQSSDADVVLGPSIPCFLETPPSWVVKGEFFERVRFRTGQPIAFNYARTSGVLIRRSALPSPTPFDEGFRYSGGSDHQLFSRMATSGRRFVWVDEARVIEHVPPTRATLRWLIARAYRTGVTRSLTLVTVHRPPLFRRLRRVAGGMLEIATGGLKLVQSLLADTAASVRALQRIANGAGLIAGALGFRYNEYRTVVHGT